MKSTMPENIGALTSLISLISINNFYGTIPTSFGNLIQLSLLHLDSGFIGTLPSTFNQLVNLNTLDLINSDLTGSLPDGLSGLTQLEFVTFDEKNLRGVLRISSFPKLKDLLLYDTELQLCGCFAVPLLRQCNITKALFPCNCRVPLSCGPPVPCNSTICS